MKSLKVSLKNRQSIISQIDSEEHSLTFLLSYKKRRNEEICTINITGTDLKANKEYRWLSEAVETTSKVVVEIGEFANEKSSKPIQIVSEQQDFIIEQKLSTYRYLKSELESQGLI